MNIDEVNQSLAEQELPGTVTSQLAQVGWREKLAGVKELYSWMVDNMGFCREAVYLIFWETKKFKESNPKVNKAIYKIFMKLSEDIDDKKSILTPENVGLVVKLCVERLNDKNFSEKSIELLTRCFSVVNPKSILASYLDFLLTKPLNPKMCVELEEFFSKIMPLLTCKYLPFSEMMSYAKNTLNSKEASSRKVGMTIITNFYSMMGDEVRVSLDDVHPNVLKTLDGEFKKRSVNTKLEPTIEIVGNKKPVVAIEKKNTPLAFS